MGIRQKLLPQRGSKGKLIHNSSKNIVRKISFSKMLLLVTRIYYCSYPSYTLFRQIYSAGAKHGGVDGAITSLLCVLCSKVLLRCYVATLLLYYTVLGGGGAM